MTYRLHDRAGRCRGTAAAAVAVLGVLTVLQPSPAAAQRGRAAAGEQARPVLTPAETQRLFDGYVMVRARDALGLTDAQYPDFVTRLTALQDARRQYQQARRRTLAVMAKLTAPGAPLDEAAVRRQLRSLAEVDAQGAEEVKRAQEALDQVLDLRQQARFRVFEEQVERQKFELLLRARRQAPGSPK